MNSPHDSLLLLDGLVRLQALQVNGDQVLFLMDAPTEVRVERIDADGSAETPQRPVE